MLQIIRKSKRKDGTVTNNWIDKARAVEIYTGSESLSLHDALPIYDGRRILWAAVVLGRTLWRYSRVQTEFCWDAVTFRQIIVGLQLGLG